MKKWHIRSGIVTVLAVSVMLAVAASGTASAGDNKWEEVQAKLASLQQQIDAIELTPGPQGPQGEPGPTGPAGPQGPAGPGVTREQVYQVDSAVLGVAVGPSVHLEAACRDTNDVLLSGSFWVSHAGVRVLQSGARPSYPVATWVLDVVAETGPGLAQVSAYCMEVAQAD